MCVSMSISLVWIIIIIMIIIVYTPPSPHSVHLFAFPPSPLRAQPPPTRSITHITCVSASPFAPKMTQAEQNPSLSNLGNPL